MINVIYGVCLSVALFVSGLFLYTIEKSRISVLDEEENIYSGYIEEYPEEKANSFMIVIRIEYLVKNSTRHEVAGALLLYNKKDSVYHDFMPGDYVAVRCTPLEISNRGNPHEFNYKRYSENNGIRYYSFTDKDDFLNHKSPENKRITHRALIIRERIIGMFRERGITGERLAIVAAITLGQKNMLDQDQKDNFIRSGVMHIMAVSGLHAMIISLLVFRALFFLRGRLNTVRIIAALLILWSFAFITGLTPSVLRASVMFTFLQGGALMKRRVNPVNSVLASAFVLILIKPSVIFSAGFLLSYSAVIYIIIFFRDLYGTIHFKRYIPDLIWKSAAVTIIAQAGTLPLTIMMFNRFPTLFIITNILIVPMATMIIILGCLVPLTFPVRIVSQFLADLLNSLIGIVDLLTGKISSIEYSTIENIGLTTPESVLLTLSLFLLIVFIFNRKRLSVIFPLVAILLFVFNGTLKELSARRSNQLIVYNSSRNTAIGIRAGKTLHYFSDTSLFVPEVLKHSATQNLKISNNHFGKGNYEIRAGNKKLFIAGSLSELSRVNNPYDIVIIREAKYPKVNMTPSGRVPSTLIFASRVSPGNLLQTAAAKTGADSVHFVRKHGAYNVRL
jgi:competence protein ComEC